MASIAAQIGADFLRWLVLAGLFVVGWAALYVMSQRRLKRAIDKLRDDMEVRIDVLSALIRATPKPAAATSLMTGAREASGVVPKAPAKSQQEAPSVGVTPETLLVIAAAVTAFLGKKVRVRSAKLLQTPYELINPWAQQGRVVIQASHNLAQRHHWD